MIVQLHMPDSWINIGVEYLPNLFGVVPLGNNAHLVELFAQLLDGFGPMPWT